MNLFKNLLLRILNFSFFKVFSLYKYVHSDMVNFVFGSFFGLIFLSFFILIILVKLLESLSYLLNPLRLFGRLLFSLIVLQFSRCFLNLLLDIFIVIHRIRFFLLLGASSYDPLAKIFYDSVSILKGEFLMDFYNVSSKFIFSQDFNLPTSIFSKTPVFDSSKNFFYVQVFYNLFTHLLRAHQNIRTFYFFKTFFGSNGVIKNTVFPKIIEQSLDRQSLEDTRACQRVKLSSLLSIVFANLMTRVCRIVVKFGGFFHFDFFLFLHNLNYFLMNPTVFSYAHIFLLKYLRTIRMSMMFILINLENDSFLHFINVTLYKLALRNYYTRADWDNLVNTYESSMTNSFAFSGESRNDLVFIIKISLCYGFLLCNYLLFYVFSLIFFVSKTVIYFFGYDWTVIKSRQYFLFVDLIQFAVSSGSLYFEFYVLRFCQVFSRVLVRLRLSLLSKFQNTAEDGQQGFFGRYGISFESFSILDLSLLFALVGLYFLNRVRIVWSFIILTFYWYCPVFYFLLFQFEHITKQLSPSLFSIAFSSFSGVYYVKVVKQVFDKLTHLGLSGQAEQVFIDTFKTLPVITHLANFTQVELLFSFFKLKFFVEYYLKFCFVAAVFSSVPVLFLNVYVSQFFAFLVFFSSKVFYRSYEFIQGRPLNFDVLVNQLKINYAVLVAVQYYVGLLVTYFYFYFLNPFIFFCKIFWALPFRSILKFPFFVGYEIASFLYKVLFYILVLCWVVFFYCVTGTGILIVSFVLIGVSLVFINFFFVISFGSLLIFCFVLVISFIIKVVSFLEYNIFAQSWIVFIYLRIYIWIRFRYFEYKLTKFVRRRNFGFLETLGIFFIIRNDLKKYEMIHSQLGFQVFESMTADIAVNKFLYKYLSNFETVTAGHKDTTLEGKLVAFEFEAFRSKFNLPLENLAKFKRLNRKSDFSRVQLKRDIFPEFEYHKYLRSRDVRNLSLFRFRKSLEPVDLYFDPVLDEVKSACSDDNNFFDFDFLKIFYVDDILYVKFLNYFRYIFSRKNLSFFYDDLDRLSAFRVRYSKLSPLFRYFYLKREKIKYLASLYVFGNINPFTFSIVFNWLQSYKILRAVLNLYNCFDSSLSNYLNRTSPVFQLTNLVTITNALVISLRLGLTLLFWLCWLLVSVYVSLYSDFIILGMGGLVVCFMRIWFIMPIMLRLPCFIAYLIRRPWFLTSGLRIYSIFDRFVWVSFVKQSVTKLGIVYYLWTVGLSGLVLVGLVLILYFKLNLQFEIFSDNLILIYWLHGLNLNSNLVEFHIFVVTHLEICFIVIVSIFVLNVISFFIVKQLRNYIVYTFLDLRILNFWVGVLYSLLHPYFLAIVSKKEIVAYFLLAELDLIIDTVKRENQFSRSLIRRWTK